MPIINFFIFLVLITSSCIDYIRLEDNNTSGDFSKNSPPIIDMSHISPHPSRLVEPVRLGKDCPGQAFKVPPINDHNGRDKLYYIWFLDNQLIQHPLVIEPENRSSAIISITIDEQFLLALFGGKMPRYFYSKSHVLEFLVSDKPYSIPESRYIEDSNSNEDYAYWIVNFIKDSC